MDVGDIDGTRRTGITSIGLQMEPYDSITDMLAPKQGPFVTLTIFGHAEVLRRGSSSVLLSSKSSRDAVDLKKMLLKDFNDLCFILRRSLLSHTMQLSFVEASCRRAGTLRKGLVS